MKKFVRFCGVSILTLIILGAIFMVIGISTVGWDSMGELVSKLSDGKISFEDGIRVEDEGVLDFVNKLNSNAIFDIHDSTMFDKGETVWKGDVKKTKVAKDSIEDLDLEIGGCLFEVKESEDDAYYVEYEGKGKSQAYAKGDKLYIKVLNTDSINLDGDNNCFTLYVPQGAVLGKADIELGAGQMKLDALQVDDLKVELGAGQIVSNNLQVSNLAVSVGAGDFTLKEAKLGEVKIEVGAGNCSIEGDVSEELKADCAMGNITLKLEGKETDYDYELECVSGNLKVGETEYSGLAKETKVDNDADRELDLQCVMGNIEVEFE